MSWHVPVCNEASNSSPDKKQFCYTNPISAAFTQEEMAMNPHGGTYAYRVFSTNDYGRLESNEVHLNGYRQGKD